MSKTSQQSPSPSPIYEQQAPWLLHSLVSLVILLVALAVVATLMGNKPKAGRRGDRPAPSVAVEIEKLKLQSFAVWVDSYGTVESLTRTQLVSEVNGRVMSVSPDIRAGKAFEKGDVLVRLDDRDFKVEVDIAASAVADAELAYLQEVAQAEFSAQEWNEPPETEAARKLALREPQVAAAKASLTAAKARLRQAQLNLERTRILAPFNGKVLQQLIDVGQVVGPSQAIAELYSTDVVEVRLPIKTADLHHLTLPENKQQNIRPRVILESDLGNQTYQWQAEIVRTEGAFDPATRMLFVVARVIQPFATTNERPAIRIGQFVRAKLQGKQYDDVFIIPRRAVSQDLLVSMSVDGVLQKRRVSPLWTDNNAVIVAAKPGATTNNSPLTVSQENVSANINKPLLTSDLLILTPTANLPDGTRIKSMQQEQSRLSQQAIATTQEQNQRQTTEGVDKTRQQNRAATAPAEGTEQKLAKFSNTGIH